MGEAEERVQPGQPWPALREASHSQSPLDELHLAILTIFSSFLHF